MITLIFCDENTSHVCVCDCVCVLFPLTIIKTMRTVYKRDNIVIIPVTITIVMLIMVYNDKTISHDKQTTVYNVSSPCSQGP